MRDLPKPETEEVKAIWRVGLVAYRKERRRDPGSRRDYDAGAQAILEAFPNLSMSEAKRHIVEAVAWCSSEHHAWLNRGVPKKEWIWPPDHRGVGHQRNPGYEDV